MATPAYSFAKTASLRQRHHERFKANVKKSGLMCQECGGYGKYVEDYLDTGVGPIPRYEQCGWCEGTGLVTPRLRGLWLKYKREMKREKLYG